MTKPILKNMKFTLETVRNAKKSGKTRLGEGGFGEVQLIHHISDPKKLYAMKRLNFSKNSKLFRLLDEIKLHKSLNHPHIIRLYGSQFLQKEVLIFMEYASRGDLFKILRDKDTSQPKLTFRQKIKIFIQCVQAIEYMHSQGIIHRDLKPENVLIAENFDVKLCDFGWAIAMDVPRRRRSICGTIEYMAPEITHQQLQTEKIDIWALGKR